VRLIKKGATSQIIYVVILDSTSTTGGRKTGLAFNTASLVGNYVRNGAARTAITLATLASASAAWSSGGFVEVDATNTPGLYRLDVPDAAFAAGVDSVVVTLKGATGMVGVEEEVQLTAIDLQDAVRMAMTALPNAAAEAAGGLYTRGSGAGQLNQNASGQVDTRTVTMATDVITAAAIQADAIGAAEIANGAIDAATFAAGAIDAAAIATDAIGSAELAASAVSEITAAILATPANLLATDGTGRVTVGTNADKTGYGLSAAAVQAIWDALTSALSTVGSIGKLLVDNINATISSRLATSGYTAPDNTSIGTILTRTDVATSTRLATSGYTAPPSAASVSTQVWTEPIPGAFAAGSAGVKLNSAASAGDPMATVVPGAYGTTTAGYKIGTFLDVAVSSRASGAVGGVVGSGSRSYPITVTRPDGVTPIEGVSVWVSTDSAGANVVAGTLVTDTLGRINTTTGFMLDPGAYYLWRQHGSWNFSNPTAFTVT
jgi:hypothetical protein